MQTFGKAMAGIEKIPSFPSKARPLSLQAATCWDWFDSADVAGL